MVDPLDVAGIGAGLSVDPSCYVDDFFPVPRPQDDIQPRANGEAVSPGRQNRQRLGQHRYQPQQLPHPQRQVQQQPEPVNKAPGVELDQLDQYIRTEDVHEARVLARHPPLLKLHGNSPYFIVQRGPFSQHSGSTGYAPS